MSPNSSGPGALLRLVFYAAALVMALLHVFVTFRGLSSAEGMNQAQLARQIARTGSYQTHVVQPYAWAQMESAQKKPLPLAMPETVQTPLQPLLWSVAFRFMKPWQVYDPVEGGAVFLLDRVIACFGVTWYLLTIFFTHGAARRLFDEQVAAITAIALLVCEPAWELMVSGSPRAMLVPLFALAFRLYASAAGRAAENRGTLLIQALLGMVCALMVLTHWMALWIVLGILIGVAAFLPRGRAGVIVVALFPALVLVAWGWWNAQLCGDPLGGIKALFQAQSSAVAHDSLLRDFSPSVPLLQVDDLLRRVGLGWQDQFALLIAHLGYVVPALMFFLALLHRFRKADAASARWMLAVVFVLVALGMGLLGLVDKEKDDNALYIVLMPAMSTFGAAMLVVLWSRFQISGEFMARWGAPMVALIITALPMAVNLPVLMKFGLTMGGKIPPHWPPFLPERAYILRLLMEKDEFVISDSPAFVAWYGDVPCVNLSTQRADYELMKTKAEERGVKLAGFVMTPVSAKVERITDVYTGPYSEWRDLVIRGPMLAFDRDFSPSPEFPFKIPIPLVGLPVGEKEHLSLPMVFYTDKARTIRK
ncbi:hypothetical protein [Prosthecobacter sp.]|uniref:hypothetical protein n=1 Tax=Prosthecobacter sp. TaxID=1965333 RepID=UPI002ABA8B9E|nr:hypothetical protein [Prosthecobacter sp.]MDZ4405117.1 hypothetical protein [Prosthecobacter sp.]